MSRYQSPTPSARSTAASAASSPASTPPRRAGLVSSKAAAEFLGISPNTIRKFVAEGKLPAFVIGDKLVKFDPADLDHFLASRRVDNS